MRVFFLLILSLLTLGFAGCNRTAPKASVKAPPMAEQTLRTLYPKADSTRWEREKDGAYEAHFVLETLPHKLRVDSTGKWIETEIDVARTALPVPLQDTLQKLLDRANDPKRYRIRQVSIVRLANGTTQYEAQMRVEGKWRKRYYDEKGLLLREVKAKKG
jgi:hypothetical protein